MKFGILAASTLFGVAALAPASFAQGGGQATQEMSRMPPAADSAMVGRVTTTAQPRLESARLPAGMMPEQPSGPVRSRMGSTSSQPAEGSSLRRDLRNQ
jgi:hypothetical protein